LLRIKANCEVCPDIHQFAWRIPLAFFVAAADATGRDCAPAAEAEALLVKPENFERL